MIKKENIIREIVGMKWDRTQGGAFIRILKTSLWLLSLRNAELLRAPGNPTVKRYKEKKKHLGFILILLYPVF